MRHQPHCATFVVHCMFVLWDTIRLHKKNLSSTLWNCDSAERTEQTRVTIFRGKNKKTGLRWEHTHNAYCYIWLMLLSRVSTQQNGWNVSWRRPGNVAGRHTDFDRYLVFHIGTSSQKKWRATGERVGMSEVGTDRLETMLPLLCSYLPTFAINKKKWNRYNMENQYKQ